MKHKLSLIIGAIALAAAAGSQAQTAVTDPVGYITEKVTAAPAGGSQLSFLAPTLVNKLEFSGVASAANATTITLTGAAPITDSAYKATATPYPAYDAAAPMPQYYVEVSAGTGEGQWANITANTATTLTVDRDLSSSITGGATTVRIRKHVTLSEVFGTTNTAGLKTGQQISDADEVKVLKPVTHAVKSYFYYDDGVTATWTDADFNDSGNVSILPDQGIVVQHKATTPVSFVRVGHVKTGKTALYASAGINILGNPRAVGDTFTLGNSNLANTGDPSTHVKGEQEVAKADLLRIPQDNGSLKDFFFFDDGVAADSAWVDVSFGDGTNEPLNEGQSIVLVRQAAAGNLTWTVPAQPIAP